MNLSLVIGPYGIPACGYPSGFFENNVQEQQGILDFWSVIARHYANVPNQFFSINLIAEPSTMDEEKYTEAMTGVVGEIRSYTPNRVIIVDGYANHTGKAGAAGLSAVLPLLRAPPPDRLRHVVLRHLPLHPWPMLFFPDRINDSESAKPLTIQSENGFAAGKLKVYIQWESQAMEIRADGTAC